MKNMIRKLVFISSTLLVLSVPIVANAQADKNSDLAIKHDLTSIVEVTNDKKISVYNTGFGVTVDDKSGWGSDFRGSVDGKIDEINSENFKLGKFVKQLDIRYGIDTNDAIILLSVGKMVAGVNTNVSNPTRPAGVMGIKLSISPKQIPLIEEWMKANEFKIDRIDIMKYDSETSQTLDLKDLNKTNMTSYALYLSKSNDLQTFFVYKTPDADNLYGVTSKTVGAVYVMGGKLSPELFAMKHTSTASFMDLNLVVLSAGIEVSPQVKTALTYSRAIESIGATDEEMYDLSISKIFNKSKNLKFTTTFGAKVIQGATDNKVVYFRVEAKYGR